MPKRMKIGELAKQTGLSIRTLHYYDEIELLSPSRCTDSKHRFYVAQDIIRLQQIMSLRQLGFSLKEIRKCLEDPDFSLPQVIELHRTRLREQMALSHKLSRRLSAIAQELNTTQSVTVENLIQTMETMTLSEQQYLTPAQQDILEARFRQGEEEWQAILAQVKAEMNQGSEFNSPSVRMLARRWLWSMKSFVQGDGEIYESLVKMYQEGAAAEQWGMDDATFEYILKAVSFMTLAEATEALIPRHKIFTSDTLEVIRLGEIPIREINFHILGTEGVLLGLLAEGVNMAAQVLVGAGASYDTVHPIVVKWLGTRPTPPEGTFPPKLPFAPRMKRVIELALEEAEQLGHSQISPEHLLLGILEEFKEVPPPGGVATYILREELGVDLVYIEKQLRAAIGSTH